MLMGVAMATPDQMMGTPAKAIEAGVEGAGGPELSQPHGHHLALGRQGHLGVSPWVPYSYPHYDGAHFSSQLFVFSMQIKRGVIQSPSRSQGHILLHPPPWGVDDGL